MRVNNIDEMVGGWFVGDFEPSVYRTKDFEISYKLHHAGEQWEHHFHSIATEYNLLIKGEMTMCETKLTSGDIFTVFPDEVADPVFHTDCEVVCVKVPSVIGDKHIVEPRKQSPTS